MDIGLCKGVSPIPKITLPIGSMYGIFTYSCYKYMVNVGKYTSHMDPMGYKVQETLHLRYLKFLVSHRSLYWDW